MMTADLHQFTIRTHAETRCKSKRDRTWTIAAGHATDACDEAVELHLRLLAGPGGWYFTGSVGVTAVESVDGGPRGDDCPHSHERLWDGFVPRWDGGRDCHACASTKAVVR